MNLDKIELSTLPWVSLKNKKQLPSCAGVYVVSSDQQVLYIGCSDNLLLRWVSHHRHKEVKPYNNVKISWLALDKTFSLLTMERLLINKFQPILNGKSTKELTNTLAQQSVFKAIPNLSLATNREGIVHFSLDLPMSIHRRLEAISALTGWKKAQMGRMALENLLTEFESNE